MTQASASSIPQSTPVPAAIPMRELLPWAVFGLLLAAVLMYFVGAEEGAISMVPGQPVHEFMHDGRHLLGFPCH